LAVAAADLFEGLLVEELLIGGRQPQEPCWLSAFAEEPLNACRSEEQEQTGFRRIDVERVGDAARAIDERASGPDTMTAWCDAARSEMTPRDVTGLSNDSWSSGTVTDTDTREACRVHPRRSNQADRRNAVVNLSATRSGNRHTR
jgi:hypothetical protein